MFDVSDQRKPRAPRAGVARRRTPSSTAEFDPHAFLFWKPANLAVIPLSVYGSTGHDVRGRGRLPRRRRRASPRPGRITHPDDASVGATRRRSRRSLVIDGKLYTLSYAGLRASSLDTLAPLSFAAFPVAPRQPMPDLPIERAAAASRRRRAPGAAAPEEVPAARRHKRARRRS